MPAPFIFLVVTGATAVLIIFFGAWAVSANAEGRELTFGLTGTSLEDSDAAESEGGGQGQAAFGVAPIGETAQDAGPANTWWGKGFLKACPLH